MKFVLILIITICVTAYVAFQFGRMRALIVVGTNIANGTKAFERAVENPTERILVIGDSTAYGTGASTPEESTAGRLAADYPNAAVVNLGKNGDKVAEARTKLEQYFSQHNERYNIILIQVGANDVIRMGNLKQVEVDIKSIIEQSAARADKVIVMHSGDIGTVLLFPKPYRLLLGYRTERLRSMYQSAVAGYEHVRYVDIIAATATTDPFALDPAKYYAPDFLHPSSEGYAFWYQEISKSLNSI